jgi:hypothetical protein
MIPIACAGDAKRLVIATRKFKESKGILKDITKQAQLGESCGIYLPNSTNDADISEMLVFLKDRGFEVRKTKYKNKEALFISWY